MGVDASAPTGTPIYAIAPSTLAEVIGDWFDGEPLLLFKFDTPQSGTPDGDQYWYLAEQIIPVTTTIGTTFATGQAVAHYAPAGTGIEIGWGSPTSDQRTLAGQEGDAAAANPARGSHDPVGRDIQTLFRHQAARGLTVTVSAASVSAPLRPPRNLLRLEEQSNERRRR